MTEDEARKKWCPFARVAAPADSEAGGTAGNRWGDTDPTHPASGYRCIASDCMAWRGYETAAFKVRAEGEFRSSGRRLKPTGADVLGYCGLAGKPQ